MSPRQYMALPVRNPYGKRIGWSVFLSAADNTPRMSAGYAGLFAGWRARRRAAALNRKG